MDLTFPPEAESFCAEIRAFLEATLPPGFRGPGTMDRAEAEAFSITWRRTLFEHGYIAVTWPKEYGGRGLTKLDQVVLAQEMARAAVPLGRVADTTSVKLLGNTLVRWGTEAQKRRYLPRIISGDDVWVQGYSETEAGSDLASLNLRADIDGDHIILNGQKIWTSRGLDGTGIFVLARTDRAAAKHRGITFLLCPIDTPGLEVRGIKTLTGEVDFCEVFFTLPTFACPSRTWSER